MTSRIQQLIKLCMQEKASEAERNELLRLLQAAENEGEAKKMINEALNCPGEEGVLSGSGVGLPGDDRGISEDVSAAILEAIFQSDDGRQGEAADDGQQGEVGRVIVRPVIARLAIFRWVPYAAAVLLFIICGVVLLSKRKTQPGVITSQKSDPVKDILPGGNKAILTLADGATINLDDAKKGDIARDGNARIVKPGNNGILVYHPMPGNRQTLVYNTVTTPRGGQYQLSLSDGSKVWLNASSSIHFPTTFNGQERAVELTGEGYFEIARNTAMPFVVKANGVTVQVLGTHFNINAYNDEGAVRTTLIEGVVRVATAEQALMLKAGQQAAAVGEQALAAAVGEQALAAAGRGGESLKIDQSADLEEVMAWKNGIFNFKNLDIEAIMRQISRWYDVEVIYEGKKPEGHFSGMISRNTPAYTVLKMLEYGGVHFRIASRKIVIMP